MSLYTKEQIMAADSMDLAAFLESRGYALSREGRQHHLKEHDSLYIKGNQWYWFSQRKGGKAISFLTEYEGMTFTEAMRTLLGEEPAEALDKRSAPKPAPAANEQEPAVSRELMLPEPAPGNNAVFAYLKSRGIDSRIIKRCIDEGTIYQTDMYWVRGEDGEYTKKPCPPQVVFVGKDVSGEARYACTRSCSGSGKHDAYGSDKAYAFSIPDGSSRSLWVFESAIDALSHMTLCGYSKKDFSTHRLSLGGVAPAALTQFLADHPEIKYVNFGLDADKQGREAAESLKALLAGKYTVYDHPPVYGKDYNEDLLFRQEQFRERRRTADEQER